MFIIAPASHNYDYPMTSLLIKSLSRECCSCSVSIVKYRLKTDLNGVNSSLRSHNAIAWCIQYALVIIQAPCCVYAGFWGSGCCLTALSNEWSITSFARIFSNNCALRLMLLTCKTIGCLFLSLKVITILPNPKSRPKKSLVSILVL